MRAAAALRSAAEVRRATAANRQRRRSSSRSLAPSSRGVASRASELLDLKGEGLAPLSDPDELPSRPARRAQGRKPGGGYHAPPSAMGESLTGLSAITR